MGCGGTLLLIILCAAAVFASMVKISSKHNGKEAETRIAFATFGIGILGVIIFNVWPKPTVEVHSLTAAEDPQKYQEQLDAANAAIGKPTAKGKWPAKLPQPPKIVSDFQHSGFVQTYGEPALDGWSIKTDDKPDGINWSFGYNDYGKTGNVDFHTGEDGLLKAVSIYWTAEDGKVFLTRDRVKQIRLLVEYLGRAVDSEGIITFAKANFRKNTPGGVGNSPKSKVGSMRVQCGITAGDVSLVLYP